MTKQSEVINDPKYVPVLDHGFIGIVETMGTDSSIVQAARVSYGDGTKTIREDRGLIRYLMRHKHTSPFEMCQIKIHLKIPIFVMRQWVRHRTASLNEYSGRYSTMTDEFYMPAFENIQPQSQDNKQGREGSISDLSKEGVQWMMKTAHEHSYGIYKTLLGDRGVEDLYDPYSSDEPLFDDDFPGIARELARTVLPVGNYTELYWSQNLHNMMHLLKLRMDGHAQYEIRVFADALYDLIQPMFPAAIEAFDDYVRQAKSLSRMESNLMSYILSSNTSPKETLLSLYRSKESEKDFAESYGLSQRELKEFVQQWNLPTFAESKN